MECIAQLHHPFRLLRSLRGHRPRKVATIISNHPYGQTIQARQANDLTVTIKRGYLEKGIEVHHMPNDLTHFKRNPAIPWNNTH